MLGRFLELSTPTRDIAASAQFYERLGLRHLVAGDAFSHRYAVLSDGRLNLGLHECEQPSPALTFVVPDLQRSQLALQAAGTEIDLAQLGEERLNRLRVRDPAGHALTLLEARTFSPATQAAESLCGYFLHLSLPQSDFDAAGRFWENAGFVALPEEEQPYPHQPLTSDTLDLAFHHPRLFNAPMLVFETADLTHCTQRLRQLEFLIASELPRGVERGRGALLETPDGNSLLIVQAL